MASTLRRPISYSEGYIPPTASFGFIVLDEERSPRPVHTSQSIQNLVAPPVVSTQSKSITIHIWALRFSFHLTLIALFETVFFWLYVSSSEDGALIHLVNGYAGAALSVCQQNGTGPFVDLLYMLLNQSSINAAAVVAEGARAHDNGLLYRNSWLYFSALAAITTSLGATAKARRLTVHWRELVAENGALVLLLGLYELMFFRTVVFQYEATSMAELDGMVLSEFYSSCPNSTSITG